MCLKKPHHKLSLTHTQNMLETPACYWNKNDGCDLFSFSFFFLIITDQKSRYTWDLMEISKNKQKILTFWKKSSPPFILPSLAAVWEMKKKRDVYITNSKRKFISQLFLFTKLFNFLIVI